MVIAQDSTILSLVVVVKIENIIVGTFILKFKYLSYLNNRFEYCIFNEPKQLKKRGLTFISFMKHNLLFT